MDIQSRRKRLKKNCAELPNMEVLQQLAAMYEIIADARFLRVKISDYLCGHQSSAHHQEQQPVAQTADGIKCPYCTKISPTSGGLKAHLGVRHPELKSEWTGKY